jgi:hypothetical protein
VAPASGHWEVVLTRDDCSLRAHLPLRAPPPAPGDAHAVRIDPELATLID